MKQDFLLRISFKQNDSKPSHFLHLMNQS